MGDLTNFRCLACIMLWEICNFVVKLERKSDKQVEQIYNYNKDMKKIFVLSAAVLAAVAMVSCGSSKESAYRKAYEKAKAQEQVVEQQPVQQEVQTPVVTPVQPAEQKVVDNYDNENVRQENLTVVSGEGLKSYSVVVGSFGVKANAEGLQRTLRNAGYNAQIAYNSARNMYRVVATTFASKADAVNSRNSLRGTYPDAWLLFNQ